MPAIWASLIMLFPHLISVQHRVIRLAMIEFFQKGILGRKNCTKLLRVESQYAKAFGEFKDVPLNEVRSIFTSLFQDCLLVHSCVDDWKVLHLVLPHLFLRQLFDSLFHLRLNTLPIGGTPNKLALYTGNK